MRVGNVQVSARRLMVPGSYKGRGGNSGSDPDRWRTENAVSRQCSMQFRQLAPDAAVKFSGDPWLLASRRDSNKLRLQDEMDDCVECGRTGLLPKCISRWKRDGTFKEMSAEHTLHRGVLP